MTKLDHAMEVDLTKRAEELSKEAEALRNHTPSEGASGRRLRSNKALADAVAASVLRLRKLSER